MASATATRRRFPLLCGLVADTTGCAGQVLEPTLLLFLEEKDCAHFYFCFRWLLILFKVAAPCSPAHSLGLLGGRHLSSVVTSHGLEIRVASLRTVCCVALPQACTQSHIPASLSQNSSQAGPPPSLSPYSARYLGFRVGADTRGGVGVGRGSGSCLLPRCSGCGRPCGRGCGARICTCSWPWRSFAGTRPPSSSRCFVRRCEREHLACVAVPRESVAPVLSSKRLRKPVRWGVHPVTPCRCSSPILYLDTDSVAERKEAMPLDICIRCDHGGPEVSLR
jgi:hypothetical protein